MRRLNQSFRPRRSESPEPELPVRTALGTLNQDKIRLACPMK